MNNSWQQSLITAQGDGAALASSVVATSLLPPAAVHTLFEGFFANLGQKLRVRASGRISTLAAAPGTLTLDVRLGGTVVFNGGAMTLNVNAQANAHWMLEAELSCRTIGALATVLGQGRWSSHAVIGSPAPTAGGCGNHLLPYNTAPAVGNTFNSMAQLAVDLFATWSVNNAANSIQLHQYELISCN